MVAARLKKPANSTYLVSDPLPLHGGFLFISFMRGTLQRYLI
jgi:hypothetical protein